jgi:enoyl-CoA hydratase/carnithine racemase
VTAQLSRPVAPDQEKKAGETSLDYEQILYTVTERVATITLNRPDRLNAWTRKMQSELREAFRAAERDSEVRAIVVTGAGRGFCAGADMGGMSTNIASSKVVSESDFFEFSTDDSTGRDFDQPLTYPLKVAKPVIAGINGPVAGVGLCFALFTDIRFIAPGAKVTTAFSRRGLIAEYGSSWILPRLIGPMNAADLLLSGRVVSGEEAAALGLARLLPTEGFREAVQAYAADLANNVSPRSLAVIKKQIWEDLLSTLAQACVRADREMVTSLRSDDFREGVAHFVEKRPARFAGLDP